MGRSSLPTATAAETLAVMSDVFLPTVAKGVIIRRSHVVGMAESLELDTRAVQRLQRLRDRYGPGPLMLTLPIRKQAVILSPEHVHRVLEESPEPFATASSEKRAALSHFEPRGALVSHGAPRTDRRRYNEEVLQHEHPMHGLADDFFRVVEEETEELILVAGERRGELDWDAFIEAWFCIVRRIVFGDGAREDRKLTELMQELRSDANWAFLKPQRTKLRHRLFIRMQYHVDRAEPGSLASVMSRTRTTAITAPLDQIPQWLFAFDPAGMATFRALALLAAHPEQQAVAREEVDTLPNGPRELPFLRACVLESLRLWPTTPLILRQTTTETGWETGVMPENTGVLIFAPFFHRDHTQLPFAHSFTPDLWLGERTANDWPLVPFSGGRAICPGRHVVLMLTSHLIATLLRNWEVHLERATRLRADEPLRGTLNNYSLRFRLRERTTEAPVLAGSSSSWEPEGR